MTAIDGDDGDAAAMGAVDYLAMLGAAALAAALIVMPAGAPLLADLAAAALLGIAAWIAAVDVRHFVIPDAAVIAMALIAVGLRLSGLVPFVPSAVAPVFGGIALDAALTGGVLFLVREIFYRLRGIDGLGLGDVKLGAAIGILVGVSDFAIVILLASLVALAFVCAIRFLSPDRWTGRVPYGAFLAPSACAIWWALR